MVFKELCQLYKKIVDVFNRSSNDELITLKKDNSFLSRFNFELSRLVNNCDSRHKKKNINGNVKKTLRRAKKDNSQKRVICYQNHHSKINMQKVNDIWHHNRFTKAMISLRVYYKIDKKE